MQDKDRRNHPRFPVERIPGVLALSLQADIVNLGLAGMAVECPVPLTVGKRFAVRIGRGEDQLDLVGTVRWCERISGPTEEGGRPRYKAGFAFHDVLTERAEQLLGFMERNVVVALERQMFGRLELDGEAHAELEGDSELQIHQLSLEGARVETGQPPETGETYDLELNLDGTRFAARGRVLLVRASESDRTGYRVDLEFEDLAEEPLEILRSFLRHHLA